MFSSAAEKFGHQDASPLTQMMWGNTIMNMVLGIPSLTVMVLFRQKIGYRTLQPWMLLLAFFAMMLLSGSSMMSGFNPFDGPSSRSHLMPAITVLVVGLGIYQRMAAWQRIRQGQRWHTKSRGVSFLKSVLPFAEHIIQRFIEPLICLVLGLIFLFTYSTPIGCWLLFSGTALAVLEAMIYDVQLNNLLDQLDSMVESDVAAEQMAFFSDKGPGQPPPSIEAMSGITVGFSPDIQQAVTQRRAARAARAAIA